MIALPTPMLKPPTQPIKTLYDSYIKAFRWSTDRLDPHYGGVIAFVSNGAWLDGNSADGLRKVLEKEFSSIWVFNLRGNQRTSGEVSRKEGGKIFGSGSRTPIAITLLVKNPKAETEKAVIHYYDIGDYLSREEKLAIIKKFGAIANPAMDWRILQPNEHGDWLSQRNDVFDTFIPLGDKSEKNSIFIKDIYCRGLETSRDSWVYNSSKDLLTNNIKITINFFNSETERYQQELKRGNLQDIKSIVEFNNAKISWSRAFLAEAKSGKKKTFNAESLTHAIYRPFFKQNVYFNRELNNVVSKLDSFFPNPSKKNLA